MIDEGKNTMSEEMGILEETDLLPDENQHSAEDLPVDDQKEHHEHEHHHHHHKHRHRRGKHKHRQSAASCRRKKKIIRFFRHHKHKLVNIVACIVALSMLLAFAFYQDNMSKDSSTGTNPTYSSVKIESTLFTEEIPLVNEAVLVYMSKGNTLSAHDLYGKYKGNEQWLDSGVPVTYSFDVTGLPADVSVKDGVLELSENKNYSDAREIQVNGAKQTIEIYHLKTGVRYYYRLTLNLTNGSVTGINGEFVVKNSPRMLKIEGIRNVRDFGGWKTVGSKTVKQGLLYRGTELDGAVESGYRLTSRGLEDMVDVLGIRFDMDLRSPSDNVKRINVLGDNIPHKYYNAKMYAEALQSENNETMRKVFSDLANKENYPIYIHCTHGRDRTGTVCYLLDGLLGVSKEDAYKDYELSAFVDSWIPTENFQLFQDAIDSFAGTTFQQKVENYLLSVGVTPEEITSIREIYLGE